ncbi:NGG1p interacting factor NIF3 [Candidatus Wolfebacteria bacterium]|nr:NGG1p interacting factor NIF3 [Candidatus Wolfebacteria bacterium]
MTIKQIYDLAIKVGIKNDPRGKERINKILNRKKEQYEKLSKDKKAEFDLETLINPYSDTRILVENKKPIKRILAGIDIGVSELLLAEKLKNIDLIISHHPLGKALAGLDEVMDLQAEVLSQYGIPINVAESLMKKRISEVARGISAINHNKTVDAANLLNLALMCVHTPTDNMVAMFLKERIEKENFEYVGDLMKFLKSIPEYQKAMEIKAGPKLFTGSENNRTGKIALTEITGGAEGSKDIYEKMATAGIGTIVGMHISEEHRKQAEKNHLNVVIAGHMSSDSLGMNLFLDQLEKNKIKVIPCSGLIRVKRIK